MKQKLFPRTKLKSFLEKLSPLPSAKRKWTIWNPCWPFWGLLPGKGLLTNTNRSLLDKFKLSPVCPPTYFKSPNLQCLKCLKGQIFGPTISIGSFVVLSQTLFDKSCCLDRPEWRHFETEAVRDEGIWHLTPGLSASRHQTSSVEPTLLLHTPI